MFGFDTSRRVVSFPKVLLLTFPPVVYGSHWYTNPSVVDTFWHSPKDATDATDAIDNFLLDIVADALSGAV